MRESRTEAICERDAILHIPVNVTEKMETLGKVRLNGKKAAKNWKKEIDLKSFADREKQNSIPTNIFFFLKNSSKALFHGHAQTWAFFVQIKWKKKYKKKSVGQKEKTFPPSSFRFFPEAAIYHGMHSGFIFSRFSFLPVLSRSPW